MSEESSSEKRKPTALFYLLLVIVIITLFLSLLAVAFLPPIPPFSIALTVVILLFLAIAVIYLGYHLLRPSNSILPLCQDIVDEYEFCTRCKGFYVGLPLSLVIVATRNTFFLEILRAIGPIAYIVIMVGIVSTVPIHGSLRRLGIIRSGAYRHIVGFIFSFSLVLIGTAIVHFTGL